MEVAAAITRKTTAQRRQIQICEDEYEYEVNSDMESYSDEMDSSDELNEPGNKMKSFNSYKNIDGKFRNHSKSIEPTGTNKKSSASSMKRMPTRKPDPKISNRNAIMARENRRKKKEQMEILQASVEKTELENRKLKKMLHDQNIQISKLTHESAYLRSILANKTEILSLLKCIQGNRTPITSSALNFVTYNDYKRNDRTSHSPFDMHSCDGSTHSGKSPASSSSITSNIDDDKENGIVMTKSMDPFLSMLSDTNNFILTDFDSMQASSSPYDQCSSKDFQWENLLNEPTSTAYNTADSFSITDIHDMDDNEILSTNSSSHTVNIEHNYFNDTITNNKVAEASIENTPGICLHVASGRVSLEFCATCHINSQNAWCEEI